MKKSRTHHISFSLLEVLIAITLISISLPLLYRGLHTSVNVAKKGNDLFEYYNSCDAIFSSIKETLNSEDQIRSLLNQGSLTINFGEFEAYVYIFKKQKTKAFSFPLLLKTSVSKPEHEAQTYWHVAYVEASE